MNSKLNKIDILLWGFVAVMSVLALYSTYASHLTGPIKTIVWLGWIVSFCGLSYLTSQGRQFYEFANEAKLELQKVVWPNRQETVQTTSIVMVVVVVTGFVLWGVDVAMMWAIGKITHLG